jgi:hypothetical protein
MQPETAGEYAGGAHIVEVEPIMTSPSIPAADVSRPETGSVGDLTTGIANWVGTQGEPL